MPRRRLIAGFFAVGLGVGVGGSAQAATAPGVVYSGTTSQKVPMFVRMNVARTKVAVTSWRWNATCTLGSAAGGASRTLRASEIPWNSIPVSSTGAWKIDVTQKWIEEGVRFTGIYRVVGRRAGDLMKGTLRATLVERDSRGVLIRSCTTPLVTFALGNTRRFGGMTSQGRPMAASLSLDRRKARIDWPWLAKCTYWSGGTSQTHSWRMDSSVYAIPVSSTGVWRSGRYSLPDSVRDGIRYRWVFTLNARTLAKSVTGAVSGTYSEFDAGTGKLIRRCTSGAVSFTLLD